MKIKLNPNRKIGGFSGIAVGLSVAGAVGGTIAGGIAAGIASTAGLLALGTTAASLAGAFNPKQPNSSISQAAINAQLQTDQTQLNQTQSQINDVQNQTESAKTVSYISLGLAAAGLGAGAFLLFRKK